MKDHFIPKKEILVFLHIYILVVIKRLLLTKYFRLKCFKKCLFMKIFKMNVFP